MDDGLRCKCLNIVGETAVNLIATIIFQNHDFWRWLVPLVKMFPRTRVAKSYVTLLAPGENRVPKCPAQTVGRHGRNHCFPVLPSSICILSITSPESGNHDLTKNHPPRTAQSSPNGA